MTPSKETLHFILQHRQADVRTLALQARKYPTVDVLAAVTQIAGWQAARDKVPTWAAQEGILYPVHLSLEQCSSEMTARYKAQLVKEADALHSTLVDITGGFGIDCAFLSEEFKQATYVERQEALCLLAAHNFPLLGLSQISVCHADGAEHLQTMNEVDWIFIDPARRNGHGGKTIAISDCEPNVSSLETLLLQKARRVLVKLSPMLDLSLALSHLKQVHQAHILSVGNECKELLLVLGRESAPATEEIPIHCVNLTAVTHNKQSLIFSRSKEGASTCHYASTLGRYLYEPHAALMKGGAFRTISTVYKVEKLHPNSHLYTSEEYVADFPGRKFRIIGSSSFNKKEVKTLLGEAKKANLTVRNFPATVAELRKRLNLTDGGGNYLFATTLSNDEKVLISCERPTQ